MIGTTCIVVAWKEDDGMEPTGRLIWKGSHHVPEYRSAPRPLAVVWSRDLSEMSGAKAFAGTVGGTVMVLEDNDSVLDRAKAAVLVAL